MLESTSQPTTPSKNAITIIGAASKKLVQRITKQLNPLNLKNVIPGTEQIDDSQLKPHTGDFIEYNSAHDKQIFYRMGIIDFL